MILQIKNRILRLEAIDYAAIEFPDSDSENDWIELHLIIGGQSTILYSDEALTLWHHLSQNSLSLCPRTLGGGNALEPIAIGPEL